MPSRRGAPHCQWWIIITREPCHAKQAHRHIDVLLLTICKLCSNEQLAWVWQSSTTSTSQHFSSFTCHPVSNTVFVQASALWLCSRLSIPVVAWRGCANGQCDEETHWWADTGWLHWLANKQQKVYLVTWADQQLVDVMLASQPSLCDEMYSLGIEIWYWMARFFFILSSIEAIWLVPWKCPH